MVPLCAAAILIFEADFCTALLETAESTVCNVSDIRICIEYSYIFRDGIFFEENHFIHDGFEESIVSFRKLDLVLVSIL